MKGHESPSRLDLPQIGQINFSNCLPINLPIESGKVSINAHFVDGTPQELNLLIEAGKLDISSASSFLYLSKTDLVLLPDLSISSYGPVGSVLFFSKCPAKDLAGKKIAVPSASATSIRLLSLFLDLEFGIKPQLEVVARPSIDEVFEAILLIGDEALRVDEECTAKGYRVDLGEWWTKRFKLPMVFGVFVARQEFREHFADSYRHVSESLSQAREIGTTTMLEDVIDRATTMTGLPRRRMEEYFVENLNWRLDQGHRESLQLFRQLLQRHKLL